MERWVLGAACELDTSKGLEIFVVRGAVTERSGTLLRRNWMRRPFGARINAAADAKDARVRIKAGHDRHVTECAT